ncbi:MAG: isochorismatase family protein [Thermodesulfobacteriota bacterium]
MRLFFYPFLISHKKVYTTVAGFLTNFCVESTSRTAYDKGYAVTVIKDATAALHDNGRPANDEP